MTYALLVVEDVAEHREVITTILRHNGYRVIEAANGEEAVALATREHPDLILMDLTLPHIDGWEATRRLREIPTLAHTPIIAVSAHALPEHAAAAHAAGCDDYITKPIALAAFLQRIERHLRNSSNANPESP